jgi:hypothetical protein
MNASKCRPKLWACWLAVSVAILCSSSASADSGSFQELTPPEFEKLRHELDPRNQPWAAIPWTVSVTEARKLAARDRKPIFLVVNTGNCLGFV